MAEEGNTAPIGVFDSGIGGLTVARELIRALPDEGMVYLGDTARVPYGIRSPETVRRYAREGAGFLLSKGIKLLVVACNTMSAVGLEGIAGAANVPVIGVILPGAQAAVNGTGNRKVGIIGTEATVRSGAYARAINAIDESIEVLSMPCPLFVPLVEEGWVEGEVPVMVAERYLKGVREGGVDTVVLGCTHYPLLKAVISRVMGADVLLVDSAKETARQVKERLMEGGLEGLGRGTRLMEFHVTDGPDKFRELGERFLGMAIENISKVQLEVTG